jgi:GR25 family glycosyltransferase involved in LPS biosynthesis
MRYMDTLTYKAYVLNLDTDPDRMTYMSSQLTKLSVPFERIRGFNGKLNSERSDYVESEAIILNKKALSDGEYGCSKSHKLAWEKFVVDYEKGLVQYALICEDDIDIQNANFNEIIKKLLPPSDWDYIQFDYGRAGFIVVYGWLYQVVKTFSLQKDIFHVLKHFFYSLFKTPFIIIYALGEYYRDKTYRGKVKFYRDMYLAGCYLITYTGAKMLLKHSEQINYPADKIHNVLKKKYGLRVWQYCPASVFQNKKFKSNIG